MRRALLRRIIKVTDHSGKSAQKLKSQTAGAAGILFYSLLYILLRCWRTSLGRLQIRAIFSLKLHEINIAKITRN